MTADDHFTLLICSLERSLPREILRYLGAGRIVLRHIGRAGRLFAQAFPFFRIDRGAFKHQVDRALAFGRCGILLRRMPRAAVRIGALAAVLRRRFWLTGHLRGIVLFVHLFIRRAVNDLGRCAVGRIVFEKLRRPQPALACPNFADIDDVAGVHRQPIHDRGDFCMRVIALDRRDDLAHCVAVAFFYFVNQVQRARLFQKTGIGLNVGENIAHAAVSVLKGGHVGGHFSLVEIIAAFKFQIGEQFLAGVFGIAGHRYVADFVARPFVDDESHDQPLHGFELVYGAQRPRGYQFRRAMLVDIVLVYLAADACAEETQAAVICREPFHVLVKVLTIEFALEKVYIWISGMYLRAQPGVAGDAVAHERYVLNLLFHAFIEQKDRVAVLRFVAFQQRDAAFVVAARAVVFLEFASSLLDGERIQRIAGLEPGFFLQFFLRDLAVADELHVDQYRPFHYFVNYGPPAGHFLEIRLYIDEHFRTVQAADVFFDQILVEGPSRSGANERRYFFERYFIAHDADFHHHFLCRIGRCCSGGRGRRTLRRNLRNDLSGRRLRHA